MAIYRNWPELQRRRDRLRKRLEMLSAGLALVAGVIAFCLIQYDLTGFDYNHKESIFVLWSVIMSVLGFLVAGPLMYLLLDDQFVRPRVNHWMSSQKVERCFKEGHELPTN